VRFPVILFDFDGTLVDSIRLIVDSYHHTARVHGLEPRPDAFWIAGLGTPLRVQFGRFTEDPVEIERLISTYREWNLAHHDAMVRAYPGALDTVRSLKAAGARLGIVTSKNLHGLRKGLTLCGFDGLFDVLVTSDDPLQSKPSPEPILSALDRMGADSRDALVVGDSPHDIAAGRDAGAATAACLWGPFTREQLAAERPDHWLDGFDALLRLVAPTASSPHQRANGALRAPHSA
jgi:pyrophosphatase PpaX